MQLYPCTVKQFKHINMRIETETLLAFLLLKGFDTLSAHLIACSQVRLYRLQKAKTFTYCWFHTFTCMFHLFFKQTASNKYSQTIRAMMMHVRLAVQCVLTNSCIFQTIFLKTLFRRHNDKRMRNQCADGTSYV